MSSIELVKCPSCSQKINQKNGIDSNGAVGQVNFDKDRILEEIEKYINNDSKLDDIKADLIQFFSESTYHVTNRMMLRGMLDLFRRGSYNDMASGDFVNGAELGCLYLRSKINTMQFYSISIFLNSLFTVSEHFYKKI